MNGTVKFTASTITYGATTPFTLLLVHTMSITVRDFADAMMEESMGMAGRSSAKTLPLYVLLQYEGMRGMKIASRIIVIIIAIMFEMRR